MNPVISHSKALLATDPWCEGKKKPGIGQKQSLKVSLLGTMGIIKMKQIGVEGAAIIFLVGLISTIRESAHCREETQVFSKSFPKLLKKVSTVTNTLIREEQALANFF